MKWALEELVNIIHNGDYQGFLFMIPDFDVIQLDLEGISLLHWAAINGYNRIVQKLCKFGGDVVNALSGNLHSTPMHWEIREKRLSTVILLLRNGNPSICDIDDLKAIYLAAEFNSFPIVTYLVAKGVHPDTENFTGMTPLPEIIVELAETDSLDTKNSCITCICPVIIKNCSKCDRCVAKFDHHCVWIGSYVWIRNRRWFLLYVFGTVGNGLLCTAYIIYCIIHTWWMFVLIEDSHIGVTFLMTFFHTAWICRLFFVQLYQVLWFGVTSPEIWNICWSGKTTNWYKIYAYRTI